MTPKGLPNRLVHTIASHSGPINALTFSSDTSTYVLTGSSDRQIHLHRVLPNNNNDPSPITSSPIQTYSAHGYPVLSLTCSLTNATFASSSGDRTGPFLWDVSSATTIRRFGSNSPHSHTSRIPAVTFAGESDSILISGSDDRAVKLWDTKSGDTRPVMTWTDAKDGITCITLGSPRGDPRGSHHHEILTGCIDHRLRTYDIRTGKCTTDTMPAPIVSLTVTRSSEAILIGCMDSKLRLLDRSTGTLLQSMPSSSSSSSFKNTTLRLSSTLNPAETLAITGSEEDSKIRAYDILTGDIIPDSTIDIASLPAPLKPKMKQKPKNCIIPTLAFREFNSNTPGGSEIWACGGTDGVVRVFDR